MAVEPIKKALIRGELDARGAIEVDRVFKALEKAVGNEEALKRVEKLLDRIVRERWPIRRIEQHAKKVAGGDDEESAASSGLSGEAVTAAPATVTRSAGTTPDEAAPVVALEVTADIEVVPDTPPPLFTRGHGRVVVEEARIQRGLVTPEEREQLIAVLEELLMRVRRV
jgi:hypothetical protein